MAAYERLRIFSFVFLPPLRYACDQGWKGLKLDEARWETPEALQGHACLIPSAELEFVR